MTGKIAHTVYDVATGEPLQWGDCIPFVEEGQAWVAGMWPTSRYRIVDGDPVEYVAPPKTEEEKLEAWRAHASLPVAEFALAAMGAGLVTEQEAWDWATRKSLPALVITAIDGALPPGERLAAKMKAIGSVEVHRSHPLITLLGQFLELTPLQIDALFRP